MRRCAHAGPVRRGPARSDGASRSCSASWPSASWLGATLYAGSTGTLAKGETIAGVDVGGLSTAKATSLLEHRAAKLANEPLVVHAGGHVFRFEQAELGIEVDWAGAVAAARAKGDGFGPIRGFRRIGLRAFGADVTPTATAKGRALGVALDRISGRVGKPHRDASIVLKGLRPVVVAGRSGRSIDPARAKQVILAAFADLSRKPVTLPIVSKAPAVRAPDLVPVAAKVRLAVSSSVYMQSRPDSLPHRPLAGGEAASPPVGRVEEDLASAARTRTASSRTCRRRSNRPPSDATFAVHGSVVTIVPDKPGRTLNVPVTADHILAAALSPTRRTTVVVVDSAPAKRTAKDAQAMGVRELVSTYTTYFGGVANRIHNVELVSHLIDDTLIAPGTTFSFNGTTGERNASKGFLEAPVIINGELTTGLGGGVCQVSTTVFNAAYEAGLNITARTNHALYISHYPQGRDATVNYPDVDLRFVNDTEHWLLLRTFVSSSSLTVNLYGTSPHRKVESSTAPLVVDGHPPVEKIKDPTLPKGEKVVEEAG